MRVPADRKRSSAEMRPVPNDLRRTRQPGPSQRTSTVAVDGALTRSRVMRAPLATRNPLTRTTGNGRMSGSGSSASSATGTAAAGGVAWRPNCSNDCGGSDGSGSDCGSGSGRRRRRRGSRRGSRRRRGRWARIRHDRGLRRLDVLGRGEGAHLDGAADVGSGHGVRRDDRVRHDPHTRRRRGQRRHRYSVTAASAGVGTAVSVWPTTAWPVIATPVRGPGAGVWAPAGARVAAAIPASAAATRNHLAFPDQLISALLGGAVEPSVTRPDWETKRALAIFPEAMAEQLGNRPCGGRYGDIVQAIGNTPLGRAQAALAQARRAHLGQARVAQPDRLGQGPRRPRADRGRGGEGRDPARADDPRADVGQHRHLARDDLLAQGLPLKVVMPDNVTPERTQLLADVRRGDRLLARRPGLQRRGRDGARDGRERRLVLHAVPVREPGQPERPLPRHGAGDHRGARRGRPRSSRASAPAGR